jgi:two-component system, chemotaxis family, chemotaxis protein CheY
MNTCLVVDSSPDTRKSARGVLERMGFQVVEAEDAAKALAICRRAVPAAVLLDWKMSIMAGYDFLGALLALPGGDKPRVVFCTTEGKVAQRMRASAADGCDAEPLDRDLVAAKFREAGLLTFTAFPGSGAAGLLEL